MPETSMQSESILLLLPGASKRLSALAEAPPSPPLQSEVHRFLELVICDGRYLNEVATNPRLVAEGLGFDLSAEAESELRAKPLEEHVAGLHMERFQTVDPLSIIIIVAAVVVVAAIAISRYSKKQTRQMVRDLSPRADLKL